MFFGIYLILFFFTMRQRKTNKQTELKGVTYVWKSAFVVSSVRWSHPVLQENGETFIAVFDMQ